MYFLLFQSLERVLLKGCYLIWGHLVKGGEIDLGTNGQSKIVFGRETRLPDPPLFVWCIKASLLKEKKKVFNNYLC